jgi:hypothetical protein
MRLQVNLEFEGLVLVREGAVPDQFARHELGCVRRFSDVMIGEALTKISGGKEWERSRSTSPSSLALRYSYAGHCFGL